MKLAAVANSDARFVCCVFFIRQMYCPFFHFLLLNLFEFFIAFYCVILYVCQEQASNEIGCCYELDALSSKILHNKTGLMSQFELISPLNYAMFFQILNDSNNIITYLLKWIFQVMSDVVMMAAIIIWMITVSWWVFR